MLELREHTEHLEHGTAGGGGRVEPLLMQKQVDALVMETLQDTQQIREGTAEPIDGPCGDHIELLGVNRLQQGVKPRPLVTTLGATDTGILIDPDDLPVRSNRDRFQFTTLVFRVLL